MSGSDITHEQTEKERAEALDLLIGLSQKLVQIYEGRCTDAQAVAAAILTAAVTLAALTVTASATIKDANIVVALITLGALTLSALFATVARSVAGLHHVPALVPRSRLRSLNSDEKELNRGSLLSHDSFRFRQKIVELRRCGTDETDPIKVRRVALGLWRERESNVRRIARNKERWAAAAGVSLAVAVACVAVLAALLIGESG